MNNKRTSIKNKLVISFIITIFSIASIIGYVAFSKWKASIDAMIVQIDKDATRNIMNKMETFLKAPTYLNEIADHIITNGVVDIENKKEREIFFSSVMENNPNFIYSFSFGTENGEFYGARKNSKNETEIMRSDKETNGNSRYYSLNEDFTAGEPVVEFGKFDPRTREWYKAAKEKKVPTFSPIYKHFVLDDLSITASDPIYDKNSVLKGVLAANFPLSKLNPKVSLQVQLEKVFLTPYYYPLFY